MSLLDEYKGKEITNPSVLKMYGVQTEQPQPRDFDEFKRMASNSLANIGGAALSSVTRGFEQERETGGLERLANVGKSALEGAGKVIGGVGEAIYGGTGLSVINPLDTRTLAEKSQIGIEGINKAISGVGQITGAPFEMSPGLKGVVAAPFEALGQTAKEVLKARGVDPESQEGQNIVNSIMNAAGLGLAVKASGVKPTLKEFGEFVKEVPANLKDMPRVLKETPFTAKEAAINLTTPPNQRAAKYQADIDKAVGQITQGKTKDLATAKRSLGEIDTTKVKSYKDLSRSFSDKINELKKAVDERLDQDAAPRRISDFDQVVKYKDKKATVNHVNDAMNQLSELYKKTNDVENQLRIESVMEKAKQEGLTLKEVNNLAREYGSEFGKKAFDKKGDPLTSVNAQSYENTRSGIKQSVRGKLPDKATQILDEKMSDLIHTNDLIKTMEEKVNALQQKVSERGLGEKVGGAVANALDAASFGSLKGFMSKLVPRNVGLKTLNSLDLQKNLGANLAIIERWTKNLDKKK